MSKHNKTDNDNKGEPAVELENQFIMRFPEEPANVLREVLRNGLPLKDRLSIKLDNDLRHGEVKFDQWLLHAKLLDLPTIIESMKTIDNKSFYKTADICQILICKEDEDITDEESPVRQKKKDPIKVDKKFLWPHGITPPTKNVRKRRFRKTLKKKYVEAPEIEKEVKQLLKVDNDAVNVRWEVICEDEDQTKPNIVSSSGTVDVKTENLNEVSQSVDVAEHDIFGEAVSDSEDEDAPINVMELDENSHISVDSRVSDSNSMQIRFTEQTANPSFTSNDTLVTEFSKEMFELEETIEDVKPDIEEMKIPKIENFDYDMADGYSQSQSHSFSKDSIQARREQLQAEIRDLQEQRRQQEEKIANIENEKLRERFQEIIDNLLTQETQKMQELNEVNQMEACS